MEMDRTTWRDEFFLYPDRQQEMWAYMDSEIREGRDLYECVHPLIEIDGIVRRRKEYAAPVGTLWADDVPKNRLHDIEPSRIVQSSPGRFQAYWNLTRLIRPENAEELCRRLAEHLGCDNCWNLGRVQRVAGSRNNKRGGMLTRVIHTSAVEYDPDVLFDLLDSLPHDERSSIVKPVRKNAKEVNPPVALTGSGLKVWGGEVYPKKDNGDVDRSEHLYQIAAVLKEAGANDDILAVSLRERDRSLGYDRYIDTPEEYERIILKLAHTPTEDTLEPVLEILRGWPFIGDYLRYATGRSDAPEIYHAMGALAILATVLGKTYYVAPWAGVRLYPHLWLVGISPSASMKGGPSLLATQILIEAGYEHCLYPGDVTFEKLMQHAQNNPAGLLIIPEFATLLTSFERTSAVGVKEKLTEMYESPPRVVYATKTQGQSVVERPAQSIWAASTSDWLMGKLTRNDVRGGFLARFLFVPGKRRSQWRGAKGQTKQQVAQAQQLVTALQELGIEHNFSRNGHGPHGSEVDISRVEKQSADWQETVRSLTEATEPDFGGIVGRMESHAYKLALILDAVRPGFEGVLRSDAFEEGQALAELFVKVTIRTLRDSIVDSPFDARYVRIRRMVQDKPGITRNEITRATHFRPRELDDVVQALEDGEEIRKEIVTHQGAGRPMVRLWPKSR
jgi:hypothetical protein